MKNKSRRKFIKKIALTIPSLHLGVLSLSGCKIKKLPSNSELDLSKLRESYDRIATRVSKYQRNDYYFKNARLTIWEYFQRKAWYEFLVNGNLKESKQAFYDAAKVDIHYYNLYKKNVTDLFSYGRTHVLEASLSDCESVMNEYSKIDYKLRSPVDNLESYSDMVNDGKIGHIYCDLISNAMTKDYSELDRLIGIVQNNRLMEKENQWMQVELEFFIGILEKNKDKVYRTISRLCTGLHYSRNKDSFFFKDIVSQPAQGFLKIAWINDLEIEINNALIHQDLAVIKPNRRYMDNAYDIIEAMNIEEPPLNYNGLKVKQ